MHIKLLPHNYKIIAFFVGLISFIFLIINHFDEQLLEVKYLDPIGRPVFIIALLVMSFSREKRETNDLNSLRLKHLKGAVIFGAVMQIFQQVEAILFSVRDESYYSGFEIISLILVFYLITYNFGKYSQ